jgi:hypothetical protein
MNPSSEIFTHDLMSAIRKDPRKSRLVSDALQRVDTITRAIADGKASRQDLTRAQASLVPLCGFNFGLLMPSFFPRYPFDAPLSLIARPFMFAMTCLAPNSTITLKAGRQVGKCVTGDTEIVTDRGPMTISALFDSGVPTASP